MITFELFATWRENSTKGNRCPQDTLGDTEIKWNLHLFILFVFSLSLFVCLFFFLVDILNEVKQAYMSRILPVKYAKLGDWQCSFV